MGKIYVTVVFQTSGEEQRQSLKNGKLVWEPYDFFLLLCRRSLVGRGNPGRAVGHMVKETDRAVSYSQLGRVLEKRATQNDPWSLWRD